MDNDSSGLARGFRYPEKRGMMRDIHKHKRVNEILLGPLERPALQWLAAHMPKWVKPDTCTIFGAVGAVVIFASYAMSNYDRNFLWLASLGFVINWFGDSLDGTLARFRHIERPIYGFYIDHTTDAVNEMMIILGLGLTPFVSFHVASLTLIAYLLLSLLVFIRTCVTGEFKISYSRLGPTEIRVLAILLNTVMFFAGVQMLSIELGLLGQFNLNPYDLVVGAVALLLFTFFVITAAQEAIQLAKADQ
jgi:archaetidylinositol phosphate synthase